MKRKPLITCGLFSLLMITAASQMAVYAQQPLDRVMVSVTLSPGYLADVLIVNGDPLTNIGDIRRTG